MTSLHACHRILSNRRITIEIEELEPRLVLATPAATITVNTANESKIGDQFVSLREAIELANGTLNLNNLGAAERALVVGTPANAQWDAIYFAIGNGPQVLSPTANLPRLTDRVWIFGAAPAALPEQKIQLDGGGVLAAGLTIASSKSSISHLYLTNWFTAIEIESGSDNTIVSNTIGLTPNGQAAANGTGVTIQSAAPANVIGGLDAQRNVISGNTTGIHVFSNSNVIQHNYIGTKADGKAGGVGNSGNGIRVQGDAELGAGGNQNEIIGNVIAHNGKHGVMIRDSGFALIHGNKIGVDVEENKAGNGGDGIHIYNSNSNVIGPYTDAKGKPQGSANIIAGNVGHGVYISRGSWNTIFNNKLGTNSKGSPDLGNLLDGVHITGKEVFDQSKENVLDSNVIAGNSQSGVVISGAGSTGNIVITNAVGAKIQSRDPADALANGGDGIRLEGRTTGNRIEGNYVGNNGARGINAPGEAGVPPLPPGFENTIRDNVFIRNKMQGVWLESAQDVLLAGNLIVEHLLQGIVVTSGSANITIEGNHIGTDETFTDGMSNSGTGVLVQTSNQVVVRDNIIHYNQDSGIRVESGVGIVVLGNNVQENELYGVAITGGETRLEGNIIQKNLGIGFRVSAGTGHVIKDNIIRDNAARDMVFAGGTTTAEGLLGVAGTVTQEGGELFIDGTLDQGDTVLTVLTEYKLTAGKLDIQSAGKLSISGDGTPEGGLFLHQGGTSYMEFGELDVAADYMLDAGLAHWLYGDIQIAGRLELNGGLMKLGISTLSTAGGTWINPGGVLEAYYGNLYGDVTNAGIFSMGAQNQMSNGDIFHIWGNFTQTAGGTFKCGIGGSTHDTLHISGLAKLEGLCEVGLDSGYTPANTGSWALLTYGGLDNSVGPWTVNAPPAPFGMHWQTFFDPTQFGLELLFD